MLQRIVWGVCFFVALLVNPNLGCGSSESQPQPAWLYDESEMEHAVIGTYQGTAQIDGSVGDITVTLTRPTTTGGPTPASLRLQCGSRMFWVKPAGACASLSIMTVQAELVSTSSAVPSAHLTGQFTAYYTLTGPIDLSTDTGAHLTAEYTDGRFSNWSYTAGSGATVPLNLVAR